MMKDALDPWLPPECPAKTLIGLRGRAGVVCLFVLRFYGLVNPMGSFRARSVYLTTRLLGRLSPLNA